jgi:hypothetical protein
LWGNNSSLTTPASPANAAAKVSVPRGLGLFSDPTGTFSG